MGANKFDLNQYEHEQITENTGEGCSVYKVKIDNETNVFKQTHPLERAYKNLRWAGYWLGFTPYKEKKFLDKTSKKGISPKPKQQYDNGLLMEYWKDAKNVKDIYNEDVLNNKTDFEYLRKAVDVLKQVHDLDIRHGDAAMRNFIKRDDDQVHILDYEYGADLPKNPRKRTRDIAKDLFFFVSSVRTNEAAKEVIHDEINNQYSSDVSNKLAKYERNPVFKLMGKFIAMGMK